MTLTAKNITKTWHSLGFPGQLAALSCLLVLLTVPLALSVQAQKTRSNAGARERDLSLISLPDPIVQDHFDCLVAGCSAELCVDPKTGPRESVCVWKDEYSCLPLSNCQRQADGLCGWTPTAEYQACLEGNGSAAPDPQPTSITSVQITNPPMPTNNRQQLCGNGVCDPGESVPCPTGAQCIWAGSCPKDCLNRLTTPPPPIITSVPPAKANPTRVPLPTNIILPTQPVKVSPPSDRVITPPARSNPGQPPVICELACPEGYAVTSACLCVPLPTAKTQPSAVNRPTIPKLSLPAVIRGRYYLASVTGQDLDPQESLSLSIENLPAGLNLEGCAPSQAPGKSLVNCALTGQTQVKPGAYEVTLRLTDTQGNVTTQTLTLHVIPPSSWFQQTLDRFKGLINIYR